MFRQTLRKAIASVSTTALLLGSVIVPGMGVHTAQAGVADAAPWAQTALQELVDAGVLTEAEVGNGQQAATRRQVAEILMYVFFELFGGESDAEVEAANEALSNPLIQGFAGDSNDRRYDSPVFRKDVAVMASRIAAAIAACNGSSSALGGVGNDYATAAANALYNCAALNGVDEGGVRVLNGDKNISLQEIAVFAFQLFQANDLVERGESAGMDAMDFNRDAVSGLDVVGYWLGDTDVSDLATVFGGVAVTTNAGLDVSINTYPSTTIPSGATSVPFLDVILTAGSEGDVMMSGLTFHRIGVSTVPGNLELYLYNGGSRLSNGTTVNSTTNESRISFSQLIPAGKSVTLTLRVDVGTVTATGDMGFELEGAEFVNSNAANVSGNFPLVGNKSDLSTTPGGTVTVTKNGTVATPKVGEKNVTVAKMRLTAGSTEDVLLKNFNVYIQGSLSANEAVNIRLMKGAEVLAQVDTLNSRDLAVFELENGILIGKGNNLNVSVVMDLATGQGGENIQVYIDETTDVFGIGDKFGFGVAVVIAGTYDGSDCGGANLTCTFSSIQGGDVTITSSGPAAGDIATNAEDVVLMEGTMTSVSPITFRKFAISLTVSETGGATSGLLNGTISNITDIKLVKLDSTGNAVVLGGPIDANVMVTALGGTTPITEAAGDAATAFYTFTDEFAMNAGDNFTYQIRADIENQPGLNNDTIVARVEISTALPEIRDSNSKTVTNSTSLVPGSDITGKTQTVKSSVVTFSIAATPINGDVFVKGSIAKFVCFIATNSEGQSVKITDMTLTAFIDDTGGITFLAGQDTANNSVFVKDIVGSVSLTNANGEVFPGGEAETVQSNGTVVYDNLDIALTSGGSINICVQGTISTDAFKNGNNERIAFGIAATTNVTAESSSDGNAVTVVGTPNGTTGTIATSQLITDGGSIVISVDAATPKENIDIAGSTNVETSKIKFTSTDEAFTLNDIDVIVPTDGLTDADVGEYDDNVVTVKLTYTNTAGNVVTKIGFLDSGVAKFSGLDMHIPKDDDAVLTISVDYNRIQDGADSGDLPEFNVAFHELDITSTGGETYSVAKFDSAVTAGSGISIGTVTYVDSGADVDGAVVVAPANVGQNVTLLYDNGAGADSAITIPEGTAVCFSASTTTCTTATDERGFVVSYTDGATEDTMVIALSDDANLAIADNLNILVSQAAIGYLTGTHDRHIHESKPTVAVAPSSPSGGRTPNTADSAFIYNVSADAEEDVELRLATQLGEAAATLCVAGTGATLTSATSATQALTALGNGTSCEVTAVDTAGDSFLYPTGGADLSAQQYVSFWMRLNTAAAANVNQVGNFLVATADANDGTEDQTTAITVAHLVNDNDTTAGIDTGVWYQFRDIPMPVGTDNLDTFIGLQFGGAGLIAADDVFIEGFTVYNEKWEITLNSDSSLAAALAATGSLVTIKEDGTPVGTAFIAQTSTSKATIVFLPYTQAIEITKGTTKAYTFEVNTSVLILDQSGTDDFLSASTLLGSAVAGVVTPGGFWWFDSNITVRWVGRVNVINLTTPTLFY